MSAPGYFAASVEANSKETKLNNNVHLVGNTTSSDSGNRNGTKSNTIRNVAVIAHVDHGKTTVSDALLHKAGLLHKDRVGDQDTGRSLDTLKDEKERGITIKSAAIALNFWVDPSVIHRIDDEKDESATTAVAANTPTSEVDDKICGLSRSFSTLATFRDVSKESLLEFLEHKLSLASGSVTVENFNSNRGYAMIHILDAPSDKVLALHNNVVFQGRQLIVQVAGNNPMRRLIALCQVAGIEMPRIETRDQHESNHLEGAQRNQHQHEPQFTGTAEWPALGGVMVQAPNRFPTRKAARSAAASACILFFEQQEQDHQIGSKQENIVNSVHEENQALRSETLPEESKTLVPLTINLIDSPGHIEFNAEVAAALRICDGALLVVDAVEGKAVQTEQVLIQALKEGVTPVLMINKVDRLFMDKQLSAEQVFDALQLVVDDINSFIFTHQLPSFPDQRVSFAKGSVCFGSGYFGWACSIDTFLRSVDYDKIIHNGNALRSYLSKRNNFVHLILRPIIRMHRACGVLPLLKDEMKDVNPVQRATKLFARFTGRQRVVLIGSNEDPTTIQPRKLLKKAMMAWLPAADALVDMIALHIPSPGQAQRLRAPLLYSGDDLEDDCGSGIANCDSSAPAVVYISKISSVGGPTDKKLLSFGRVFSGTIRKGDVLRAIRTDGSETQAKIAQIKICGMKGSMTAVRSAFAGQLVALEGVDQALNKAGTLTSSDDGYPIRHMRMAVSPTLHHSIQPKDRRNLTKMVTELRRIVNADGTALFYLDRETQEYILAGSGSLHIEVLVSALQQASGIEIELSDPIIGYRETVQSESSEPAMAKSENKHNRVHIVASPLSDNVVKAMSSGNMVNLDVKNIAKALVSDFEWDSSTASKIWAVGPQSQSGNDELRDSDQPTCLLVDSTFGLQIPQDFRENVIAAFQQVVHQGVLVNSPMRGVRFDLVDAKFHSDAPHRRPNSVIPAASRAMRGAFLAAKPCLSEPMCAVDIKGSNIQTLHGAYAVIGQCSGTVVDTKSDSIQALVPVRCSKGMTDALRLATQGQAYSSMVYGGMCAVPTAAEESVILETRKRKKLSESVPNAKTFIDRL